MSLPLLIICTLGLILLGLLEIRLHQQRLARLRYRIHVNGTRGKSSVTRLIAAGLREGGIRTFAKTTGTLARMILPDGREVPVWRASRPNIIEQIRIIQAAVASGADALVIECMAVQPRLQWLCEAHLVRATHGVITNARPDHLDVMGPTEHDVPWALAGMTPRHGVLFTAESEPAYLRIFQYAADDRHTRMVHVDQSAIDAITAAELAPFTYHEHAGNIALALAVCTSLGIHRNVALQGMWKSQPDPGALTEHQIAFFGRDITFINGFAANDPVSSEHIWRMALNSHPQLCLRIVIFNCRSDRPERSQQLAIAYATWPQADHVIVMGTGTYIFARAAVHAGVDPSRITFAEDARVEDIFETVIGFIPQRALVMGLGNIGGDGLPLVRYFANRALPQQPTRTPQNAPDAPKPLHVIMEDHLG